MLGLLFNDASLEIQLERRRAAGVPTALALIDQAIREIEAQDAALLKRLRQIQLRCGNAAELVDGLHRRRAGYYNYDGAQLAELVRGRANQHGYRLEALE